MTSCSLFASGLVSEVNGAIPTFSYHPTNHHGDYFGVQLTYLRGTSTCYQTGSLPQFTPVIQNEAARFSIECLFRTQGTTYTGIFCPGAPVTDIPDGVLTVSYINWVRGQPTPIPFHALFGPSPAPKAVTTTASALATSTSTSTTTVSPGFASTTTVYTAGVTQTQTNTIVVTQTQTTTNTNHVSSCSTSSSSGRSSSGLTSATLSPYPTSSAHYSTSTSAPSHPWPSSSSSSHSLSRSSSSSTSVSAPPPSSTHNSVSLSSSPTPRSSLSISSSSSSHVASVSLPSLSSSSAPPSHASSSATAPSPSTVVLACPGDNGKTYTTGNKAFQIHCKYDRDGTAIGVFRSGDGLAGCINLCAKTESCVWSTYYADRDACHLKSGQGTLIHDPTASGASWTNPPTLSSAVPNTSSSSTHASSAAASSSSRPTSSTPTASSTSHSPTSHSSTSHSSTTHLSSLHSPTSHSSASAHGSSPSHVSPSSATSSNPSGSLRTTTSASSSSSAGLSTPAASSTSAASPPHVTSASTATLSHPAVSFSSTPSASSNPSRSQSPNIPASSSTLSSSTSISAAHSSSSDTASSKSVATSSSSSTVSVATSPTATSTGISCPGDSGKTINTAAGSFVVECYIDRVGGDLSTQYPAGGFDGCIQLCANTRTCIDVSYSPNGPCYLKKAQGAPISNSKIWGARLASTASSTASSAATSTNTISSTIRSGATTSSQGPVATSPVVCPESDGQIINTNIGNFVVECGIDHSGGDMSNSPVYPKSYETCVAACASRDGCLDVSYVPNGPCYLKSVVGVPNQNANIIGAKLISGRSGPTVTASSLTMSLSSARASGTTKTALETVLPVQTVTVTTTISGTGYQCACTPTSGLASGPAASATASAVPGGTLACPLSDGKTYISDCGAKYAIECYSDRYGDDIPGGTSHASTLNDCIADCDKTDGCIDVSYAPGNPGICYKKSAIAEIRQNDNIFGARQLTACKASTKLRLHRKRVIRASTAPTKRVQKRGVYGPDYTHTQGSTTVTRTTTSTSVHYAIVTVTAAKSGTTTKTEYTTAARTATVTSSATITHTQQATVTTCPAITKHAAL